MNSYPSVNVDSAKRTLYYTELLRQVGIQKDSITPTILFQGDLTNANELVINKVPDHTARAYQEYTPMQPENTSLEATTLNKEFWYGLYYVDSVQLTRINANLVPSFAKNVAGMLARGRMQRALDAMDEATLVLEYKDSGGNYQKLDLALLDQLHRYFGDNNITDTQGGVISNGTSMINLVISPGVQRDLLGIERYINRDYGGTLGPVGSAEFISTHKFRFVTIGNMEEGGLDLDLTDPTKPVRTLYCYIGSCIAKYVSPNVKTIFEMAPTPMLGQYIGGVQGGGFKIIRPEGVIKIKVLEEPSMVQTV